MTAGYDSTEDTLDHKKKVSGNLIKVIEHLAKRGIAHDASKLQSPEKEIFDEVSPLLSSLTYGSDEYTASLARMKPALDHHYAANDHHPEHFTNGVTDMDMLQIIEMLCDWKAASERHSDGDMAKSLSINTKRFGIDAQLSIILLNTAMALGWIK